MLSGKVDLTENGVFRHSDGQNGYDIPIDYWDEGCMTSGQYEAMLRWERIFGKRHRNEKYKVFEKTTGIGSMETRCCNCGKSLFPWNKVVHASIKSPVFCHDCYEKFNEFGRDFKFPWRIGNRTGSPDMTFYNLFNLR